MAQTADEAMTDACECSFCLPVEPLAYDCDDCGHTIEGVRHRLEQAGKKVDACEICFGQTYSSLPLARHQVYAAGESELEDWKEAFDFPVHVVLSPGDHSYCIEAARESEDGMEMTIGSCLDPEEEKGEGYTDAFPTRTLLSLFSVTSVDQLIGKVFSCKEESTADAMVELILVAGAGGARHVPSHEELSRSLAQSLAREEHEAFSQLLTGSEMVCFCTGIFMLSGGADVWMQRLASSVGEASGGKVVVTKVERNALPPQAVETMGDECKELLVRVSAANGALRFVLRIVPHSRPAWCVIAFE